MNSQFRTQQEYKDTQSIQSFYEPALEILTQLINRNKDNLRSKGYDENNAAITKEEFAQEMARRFRVTQWLAHQVATSLINANLIKSFGGYVKFEEGEQ
ncbi:hypothetical protein B9T31_17505 [Acinetobacter sp. ANC 4558]|uniref:hypothetical protein n=1 Tax=Acinetobacter sp. ANC 4558 TaxID=1977876 RepID=UPI000A34382A|nr:hypothetical protein [Acinetobacter sp. ANC 4558]OTG78507.1 hypothetical protein B9T31_17505 [Acinetobacter sp. ANC 4558]